MLADATELSHDVKYHVETYIEAGEWGLALDQLGDWLVHHNLKPSDALLDEMSAIYDAMGAEPRNIAHLRAL
ncbi:MafI family immunity protein [Terricaulis sp.]|uniref:MafI family immunity protein n=1 Tax=Terricaulis sp. TaxID=2768686 RepID=UPI002AC78880|nr:MafI family immunity protein [Terricaulis sp.]MDZ4691128.1 MafI family immunity protein [Terricaulis sp.]